MLSLSSSFANLDDAGEDEEEVSFRGLPSKSNSEDEGMVPFKAPAGLEPFDDDMVPSTALLPDDVVVSLRGSRVHFHLRCQLNVKEVCCKLRNAEYNPRKGVGRLLLRLIQPRAHAWIWSEGNVLCTIQGSDDYQKVARRITRMIQNCGYPDAQCKSFRLVEQSAVADLRFPVRLEALAQKWARHVMYEPEVCCMANFYLKHPRSRVQVWASGKVRIA
eukprot:CAMPEP_0181460114 /NCGR_PEP_ID=MMETSP1110-20121109/33173_1 /TAXON_ID=174948 /ORGANISM="Symbiodinium sp., Strain CCMP421" /LENGTH=217 /DNA_ID=CAMNT_0023584653 /DNA_START=28 /DNA_END=677 /DNA_ORIENTATION=-